MTTIVLLLVAILLPTATGYSVVLARSAKRRYDASRPALPSTRPIEAIWRDLRRLRDQLERIENAPADTPAKNARCRATRAAYLDALHSACTQLEVPVPTGRPVPDAEIFRAEAELRHAGLDVRPVG